MLNIYLLTVLILPSLAQARADFYPATSEEAYFPYSNYYNGYNNYPVEEGARFTNENEYMHNYRPYSYGSQNWYQQQQPQQQPQQQVPILYRTIVRYNNYEDTNNSPLSNGGIYQKNDFNNKYDSNKPLTTNFNDQVNTNYPSYQNTFYQSSSSQPEQSQSQFSGVNYNNFNKVNAPSNQPLYTNFKKVDTPYQGGFDAPSYQRPSFPFSTFESSTNVPLTSTVERQSVVEIKKPEFDKVSVIDSGNNEKKEAVVEEFGSKAQNVPTFVSTVKEVFDDQEGRRPPLIDTSKLEKIDFVVQSQLTTTTQNPIQVDFQTSHGLETTTQVDSISATTPKDTTESTPSPADLEQMKKAFSVLTAIYPSTWRPEVRSKDIADKSSEEKDRETVITDEEEQLRKEVAEERGRSTSATTTTEGPAVTTVIPIKKGIEATQEKVIETTQEKGVETTQEKGIETTQEKGIEISSSPTTTTSTKLPPAEAEEEHSGEIEEPQINNAQTLAEKERQKTLEMFRAFQASLAGIDSSSPSSIST
uniref:DUF148 domain-containing protein n=1 Tax=Rhabditophanes sp. KR3021 TaxID=114890 RepID=A0AC35TRH1_9BILA